MSEYDSLWFKVMSDLVDDDITPSHETMKLAEAMVKFLEGLTRLTHEEVRTLVTLTMLMDEDPMISELPMELRIETAGYLGAIANLGLEENNELRGLIMAWNGVIDRGKGFPK